MDYRHAEHVASDPDALYAALADVDNLPRYVPQVRAARPAGGDHVEVEARYEGQTQQGEAWFEADAAERQIRWGTDGGPYRGSLLVEPDGEGSRLTLELTTAHADDVDADVAGTLDAIRRLVEKDV